MELRYSLGTSAACICELLRDITSSMHAIVLSHRKDWVAFLNSPTCCILILMKLLGHLVPREASTPKLHRSPLFLHNAGKSKLPFPKNPDRIPPDVR